MRGAASGGAVGALRGVGGAEVGATGGALKALIVELPEKHSADVRLARARLEATEDASKEVPRLKLVVAEAEVVARRLVDDVVELTRHQAHERVTDYDRSLLAMTRAGEVDPDDFDRDDARQAVAAALRASVEATSSEVVPLLARLSSRPLDSFVRGVCRLAARSDVKPPAGRGTRSVRPSDWHRQVGPCRLPRRRLSVGRSRALSPFFLRRRARTRFGA